MKKSTVRTTIVALMAAASLGSYVYLNTVDVCCAEEERSGIKLEQLQHELEEQAKSLDLPDITIIKKAIEVAKRFIPAS